MKTKLLQEFLNSNIKIKSLEKLHEYIDYCIENNQGKRIKGETAHHHILPKAKRLFPEYKDLKKNIWNGTYLLFHNHLKAHYLLALATEQTDMVYSYDRMCGEMKDYSDEEYNRLHILRYKLGGKRISEIKNSIVIDEKGITTTNAKLHSKKIKDIKAKLFEDENGNITSMNEIGAQRCAETKKIQGKFFRIMRDEIIIIDRIARIDLRNISLVFENSSKENYFGKSNHAKSRIIKSGNEDWIGCHAIEI